MIRSLRVLPALIAAGLTMTSASAAPTVQITGVDVAGGVGTVTGTFDFSDLAGAQSVGGDGVRFDPVGDSPQIATALGIGLVDASIEPIADGLRFIWHTDGLPPQVPPEGVRYTWSFAIGSNTYQLQAKVTNLASITTLEAPVEHVQHVRALQGFFQLRGACVASYEGTPTAGCYHLAFLNGAIDATTGRISIDLPWQTRDRIGRLVAPDFVPGATLVENLTAAMSIAASLQAVVSNATISSYINGWPPYRTAPDVDLAIATGSLPAEFQNFKFDAAVAGNTFSGQVSPVAGSERLVARACFRATCVYDES